MKMFRTGFVGMLFALGAMIYMTSANANGYENAQNPAYNYALHHQPQPGAYPYGNRAVSYAQRAVGGVIYVPIRTIEETDSFIRRRGRDVKRFFLGRGYSGHASAAIAGHIRAESAMQTAIRGDGGWSAGLAQWGGPRLVALKRFAGGRGTDWHDFDTQLGFLDHELRTSETLAYEALQRSTTVAEATAAFMHFERPLGYTPQAPQRGHNFHGRLSYAVAIYADYKASVVSTH